MFLSILEDDIFRTLERIECNQPYYTTLPCVDHIEHIVLCMRYLLDHTVHIPGPDSF